MDSRLRVKPFPGVLFPKEHIQKPNHKSKKQFHENKKSVPVRIPDDRLDDADPRQLFQR
jgi:hypothetical protein